MKYKQVLLLFLIVLLVLPASAEPTELDICVEPGWPHIIKWDNIHLQVFWPCSKQNRVDEWGCLMQVLTGSPYRELQRLELHGAPGPENEHTVLTVVHNFGQFPGVWTAMQGSCFALKDGVVHYNKTITGLPQSKLIPPSFQVMVPVTGSGLLMLGSER